MRNTYNMRESPLNRAFSAQQDTPRSRTPTLKKYNVPSDLAKSLVKHESNPKTLVALLLEVGKLILDRGEIHTDENIGGVLSHVMTLLVTPVPEILLTLRTIQEETNIF
jgi:hypothetical protein